MRTRVLGITAIFLAAESNADPTKCADGREVYGERCISRAMADYVSCIEASGGNRVEIVQYLNEARSRDGAASARGQGSGVVAKGSGAIDLSLQDEKKVIGKIETRWFGGAMSECARALDPQRRPTAEARLLQRIANNTGVVADNTPSRDYPVVDLAVDLRSQVQLFATDEVTVVGLDKMFAFIRLGSNTSVFRSEDQAVKKFTVWGPTDSPIIPEFLNEDQSPLREGHVKLLVEYRSSRKTPRDLRAEKGKAQSKK